MKSLFVTMYQYREDLDEDGLRELTKRFAAVGQSPSVTVHYSRLDGRGGFLVQEAGNPEQTFEFMTRYAPWIHFEMFPVTTIEEAFPVIQRVYG